jgi:hypothetical protein
MTHLGHIFNYPLQFQSEYMRRKNICLFSYASKFIQYTSFSVVMDITTYIFDARSKCFSLYRNTIAQMVPYSFVFSDPKELGTCVCASGALPSAVIIPENTPLPNFRKETNASIIPALGGEGTEKIDMNVESVLSQKSFRTRLFSISLARP